MSDFTFLKEEQCFGTKQLNIFKKRGIKAAMTDFSILLGGFVAKVYIGGVVGKVYSSLDRRAGDYWTKSDDKPLFPIGDDEFKNVRVVSMIDGTMVHYDIRYRRSGARLVLPFSSIYSIPMNGESGALKRAADGVLEVEYGYYPQNAVSKDMQEKLEIAFKNGSLLKTGKYYTTDSRKNSADDEEFLPKQYEEFELNGKKYIRVEANSCFRGKKFKLSNGESYIDGDFVWVEVAPIKWLVDEEEKIMVTEKLIFSGVQFNNKINYNIKDFDKTNIKKFIDEYWSKEIVQHLEQLKINSNNKNPYNLDFSETSNEDIIKGAIEANVAIFLHGKIGCGKSDRVKELDPDFTELNLSHLDPELLDGLAGEKDGKAVHIKPPWLEEIEEKCEKEPNKIHILFLEELTNASKTMQSKAYGIALDKKVAGRWKLPENVRVVAAGNELEDSIIANEMAEPLYDRFAHVNIETNADNWLEWAVTPESTYERLDYKKIDSSRPKIHPAIYAYVSAKGDEVLRTKYNPNKPEPYANPRRWEMASDMLYATNNPSTLRAIIGEDLTRDFISFCQMPSLTVEEVLDENYIEER
jgi:hypothetical protein